MKKRNNAYYDRRNLERNTRNENAQMQKEKDKVR